MIPKMNMKELEQKYNKCYIRFQVKDVPIVGQVSAVLPSEYDSGTIKIMANQGMISLPVPSGNTTLYLNPPKGGLVNLDMGADPFIIQRTADKQYHRGFSSGSHSVFSLPLKVLGHINNNFLDISVDWNIANTLVQKGQIFSFDSIEKMYDRKYPNIDEAVKEQLLGKALSSKFAIVKSTVPQYQWEFYRETSKIGHVDVDKKRIYCHPLYWQEVTDFLKRRRNNDWSVHEK